MLYEVITPYELTFDAATGGSELAEGTYSVAVALTDGEGSADSTLVFLVDSTSPMFLSLDITGPEGSFANGDYIPLIALMDA